LALRTGPSAAGPLAALADRIERWPIENLRAYEHNPRTHSEAQVDQIAASMVEFGWPNPVLVDEQGAVLAGHGRLEEALARTVDRDQHEAPSLRMPVVRPPARQVIPSGYMAR
jgi:hypothetical protein